jgi:hypothetical protein
VAGAEVRVEVVKAWDGVGCTREMINDLPALVAKVRPLAFGWLPDGPAAAVAADLADRKSRASRASLWPPRGVRVEEIRSEVTAVCMGLAELTLSGHLLHAPDPLLDAHVLGAEKLPRGGGWVLARKGVGHCDAAYAAAGAVHLARTLPTPLGKPRVIASSRQL